MSHLLLQIVQNPPLQKRGAIGLVYEFVVDPRSVPYLVSSSKTPLMWIERPIYNQVVRAAVQYEKERMNLDSIFRWVTQAVVERGQVYEYGNSFPYSEEGILEAARYVRYFLQGMEMEVRNPNSYLMEILVRGDSPWATQETLEVDGETVPLQAANWLPDNTAIAVPRDRGFLGDVHLFGESACAVVVHNPARGMAVACQI